MLVAHAAGDASGDIEEAACRRTCRAGSLELVQNCDAGRVVQDMLVNAGVADAAVDDAMPEVRGEVARRTSRALPEFGLITFIMALDVADVANADGALHDVAAVAEG